MILLGDLDPGAIQTQDCGEELLDLRDCSPRLRVDEGRSQISSRSPHFTWAREGIARRLTLACEALPPGLCLLLKEAYRPAEGQRRSWDACVEVYRTAHPDLGPEAVRKAVARYVAPPELAGHPTGGALDLSLADPSGELDLGTAFNAEPDETGGRTYLAAPGLGPEARALRAILAVALGGAGFLNYPSEWWHWSYGDPYWAFVRGTKAIYGPIEEASLGKGSRSLARPRL